MPTYRPGILSGLLVLGAVVVESCATRSTDTPDASAPERARSDGGASPPAVSPMETGSDGGAFQLSPQSERDASTPGDGGGDADVGSQDPAATEQDLRCQADAALAQITDYGQPGPYKVGTLDLAFSDTSRPIEATEHHTAAAARDLPTRVYYPASSEGQSAPLASDGPFPMLMYSHGYSSNSDESATSGQHAASHGYVVVSPTFPLTSLLSNGGDPDTRDIPNQPGDISFLIDRMLELSKDPSHVLAGAVDADRIGALGVSAGGLTTLLVSLHAKYYDSRIAAALPVAPFAAFFERPFYHATRALPMLIVQGDLDAFLPYKINGLRAFERARPYARLLTVARGSHAAFAMPIDELTEQLVATLLVPPEWSTDNPDAMGCAAVGKSLQKDPLAVLETLEGPYVDHSLKLEGDDVVCQGPELSMPAMGISDQRAILAASVVSFFDAHFGATDQRRQDGCRYLLYELPKNPAVNLQ